MDNKALWKVKENMKMNNVDINKTLNILNSANNVTINRMENSLTEWTVENTRTGKITDVVIDKEENTNE